MRTLAIATLSMVVLAATIDTATPAAKKKGADAKKDGNKKGENKKGENTKGGTAESLKKQASGKWNDTVVEKAIEAGIKALFAKQAADGSFAKGGKGEPPKRQGILNSYKSQDPRLRKLLMGCVQMQPEPKRQLSD